MLTSLTDNIDFPMQCAFMFTAQKLEQVHEGRGKYKVKFIVRAKTFSLLASVARLVVTYHMTVIVEVFFCYNFHLNARICGFQLPAPSRANRDQF